MTNTEIEKYKELISNTLAEVREDKDTLTLYLADSNGKESKYSHIVSKIKITQYAGDIEDLVNMHIKELLVKNAEELSEKTTFEVNLEGAVDFETGEIDKEELKKRFQPSITETIDFINENIKK